MRFVGSFVKTGQNETLKDLKLHPPYQAELSSLVNEFSPLMDKNITESIQPAAHRKIFQRFQMRLNMACITTYAVHLKVCDEGLMQPPGRRASVERRLSS